MNSAFWNKVSKSTQENWQKRFQKNHAHSNFQAADFWRGSPVGRGNNAGLLGTWDNCPLRTDSASLHSLESFIHLISLCNSCSLAKSSSIVFWIFNQFSFREFINSKLLSPLQFFYFMNSTNTGITKVLVLDLLVLREVDFVLVWSAHFLQEYALFPMHVTQFDYSVHEFGFRHHPLCTHVSGFRIWLPRAVPFQHDPDLTVIRLLARHAFLCQPSDGLHCAC